MSQQNRSDTGDESNETLSTMKPDPEWDAAAFADAVETLSAEGLTFRVWGGDWCGDCRAQLPSFAAALDAADVPADRIEQYPVEKTADGEKEGPGMEAYGVEFIPTVIVERDGHELARFVESAAEPISVDLARQLSASLD